MVTPCRHARVSHKESRPHLLRFSRRTKRKVPPSSVRRPYEHKYSLRDSCQRAPAKGPSRAGNTAAWQIKNHGVPPVRKFGNFVKGGPDFAYVSSKALTASPRDPFFVIRQAPVAWALERSSHTRCAPPGVKLPFHEISKLSDVPRNPKPVSAPRPAACAPTRFRAARWHESRFSFSYDRGYRS